MSSNILCCGVQNKVRTKGKCLLVQRCGKSPINTDQCSFAVTKLWNQLNVNTAEVRVRWRFCKEERYLQVWNANKYDETVIPTSKPYQEESSKTKKLVPLLTLFWSSADFRPSISAGSMTWTCIYDMIKRIMPKNIPKRCLKDFKSLRSNGHHRINLAAELDNITACFIETYKSMKCPFIETLRRGSQTSKHEVFFT